MSDESYIRNVIEAALLAAGKPVQLPELAQLFEESRRPPHAEIREILKQLAVEYAARGIEVKETAGGFRIQVRPALAPEVSRLWPERPVRYSRALLETLALIAYRQPITRGEIEAVRGVAVNPNILKTVIERNWVRVVGHREVPGRPELLGTTRDFLDYFGLKSLDELPPLAELKLLGEVPVQLPLPEAGLASEGGASTSQGAVAAEAAADPPSPFVESVIAPAPAEPETLEGALDEPAPGPTALHAAPSQPEAHLRQRRQDAEPALDEEQAEQVKAAAEGKPGMAAGPRDLDD